MITSPDTAVVRVDPYRPDEAVLARAGAILRAGGLVAFPTETVYGLGGNATDPDASRKIYAAKGRPSDNPLIVHIAQIDAMDQIALEVPEAARSLAEAFWPGPLTLILRKNEQIPYETTGGLDSVAVRMPSHPVAAGLIRCAGGFVAAPSANASGRPSPTTAQHVETDLSGRIDMILDGGSVEIGLESTIVDCTVDPPEILRPGYISEDMVRSVIGAVRTDPGLLPDAPEARPKAPGMKYRHYAPQAELILVDGEAAAERIRALAGEAIRSGRAVGILCGSETAPLYEQGTVRVLGSVSDEDTIARHLYKALRDFDADGVDVIYAETFHTPRIGPAIMNRLRKAAGGRIIET